MTLTFAFDFSTPLRALCAPILMSEDEEEGGSVADRAVPAKKSKEEEEKTPDPAEILEDDIAGPQAKEKAEDLGPDEEKIEQAL